MLHILYSRLTESVASSLLLPHRLAPSPGLELDTGDGSLLSVGIHPFLEGIPHGGGSNAGVVDVGKAGCSPESHFG